MTSPCDVVILAVLLLHCSGAADAVISGSGHSSGYPYSGTNTNGDPSDPPGIVGTCPDSCNCMSSSMVRCEGRSNINQLSFRGLGLIEVPTFRGNYPNLRMIDLSDNRIRVIRSGAFTNLNFPGLRNLILANNAIEDIENFAFQLSQLTSLDLSNNFLQVLREDAFQILSAEFSTIILQNNLITNVEFDPSSLTRDNLPFLFVFVAGNPLPCNRDEPLASPPTVIALCVGGFFGSDLATCIYETPTIFETVPIDVFCDLVYEELMETTTEPSTPPSEDRASSNMNIIVAASASVGGIVGFVAFILCPVATALICIRLKKWEKKFNEVTIQNAEHNLQLQHTLNPFRPPEQLSPRYARGPLASLPPLPGQPPKKITDDFFPAPPGVIPKIPPGGPPGVFPPGGPPKIPPGTIPRQFQNNTYDPNSEEIYEHIDERPLPSTPDEVEYGDNYYILNVASIPQKSPSNTSVPSPVAEKKIVQAEINHPPPSASETAVPASIESDHESDDERCPTSLDTKTKLTVDNNTHTPTQIVDHANTFTQPVKETPHSQQQTGNDAGGMMVPQQQAAVGEQSAHTINEEVEVKSPNYVNTTRSSQWATKKQVIPKVSDENDQEPGLTKMPQDVSEVDIEDQEVAYLSVVL